MKKSILKKSESNQALSKEQMKRVLGGSADSSGSNKPSTGTGNTDADRYLACDTKCKSEASSVLDYFPAGTSIPNGGGSLMYASCMSTCLGSAMN